MLDDDKHHWIDEAEIEKLMRRGEGWLATPPERDLIVRRYLKPQAQLVRPALARLDEAAAGEEEEDPGAQEQLEEEPLHRVHECVFGVLAMESVPVDPRL